MTAFCKVSKGASNDMLRRNYHPRISLLGRGLTGGSLLQTPCRGSWGRITGRQMVLHCCQASVQVDDRSGERTSSKAESGCGSRMLVPTHTYTSMSR